MIRWPFTAQYYPPSIFCSAHFAEAYDMIPKIMYDISTNSRGACITKDIARRRIDDHSSFDL
jgi:hypothetical protein